MPRRSSKRDTERVISYLQILPYYVMLVKLAADPDFRAWLMLTEKIQYRYGVTIGITRSADPENPGKGRQ